MQRPVIITRHRLLAAAMCLLALALLPLPTSHAVTTKTRSVTTKATLAATTITKPNILFILTDDQRSDAMGYMNTVKSKLIAKGIHFRRGFVVNSLCCPSRASILTGKYSHSTGVYANVDGVNIDQFKDEEASSTLPIWLQSAGYKTAFFGKYLNGYKAEYIPPGWNRWFAFALGAGSGNHYYQYHVNDNGTLRYYGTGSSNYSTDVLKSKALSFINNTANDPFFIEFAPKAPHDPATPAPRHATSLSSIANWRPPNYNEADVKDKPLYIRNLGLLGSTARSNLDAFRKKQLRSLLAVDEAINAMINALANSGRLSNTIIVFASDNGLGWGEHRWAYRKEVPYEESIKMPVVVRWDAVLGGTARIDSTHFILNIDFAPTFADIAGVSAPGADGQSFLSLIQNASAPWSRTDFLIEHIKTTIAVPTYCAVRNTQYIYVSYQTGEKELYDLAADPYEMTNRANNAAYATIKQQLANRLAQLCSPAPPGLSLSTATVSAASLPKIGPYDRKKEGQD